MPPFLVAVHAGAGFHGPHKEAAYKEGEAEGAPSPPPPPRAPKATSQRPCPTRAHHTSATAPQR
jgi:hypothetical protein